MKLADFVREELVLADIKAPQKDEVVEELAALVAGRAALDPVAVARILKERELLASTAIGDGVAIPHGKLGTVTQLVACLARSIAGVDFASHDGRPTHLFFVLVAPENSTGVHLKALARISRLFKDPGFRARLMAAADAREMYEALVEEDGKY
jgi:PTS system nitrogen regulatory IIA component